MEAAQGFPHKEHLFFCFGTELTHEKVNSYSKPLGKRQLSIQGFRNQPGHFTAFKHPAKHLFLQTNSRQGNASITFEPDIADLRIDRPTYVAPKDRHDFLYQPLLSMLSLLKTFSI
jgi:hypothetical protein